MYLQTRLLWRVLLLAIWKKSHYYHDDYHYHYHNHSHNHSHNHETETDHDLEIHHDSASLRDESLSKRRSLSEAVY